MAGISTIAIYPATISELGPHNVISSLTTLTKQGFNLASNIRATTCAAEALCGAQYAVHAVPVQVLGASFPPLVTGTQGHT